MSTTTYTFTIQNRSRFLTASVSSFLFVFIPLGDKYILKSDNEYGIFFLIIFLIASIIIGLLFSSAKVQITVSESGIYHQWKRFFFLDKKINYHFYWKDIIHYSFHEYRPTFLRGKVDAWNYFILFLKDKTKYQFTRFIILPNSKDFKQFQEDFPIYFNKYVKVDETEKKNILKGTSIFREKYIRIFVGLLNVFAITLIILYSGGILGDHLFIPILTMTFIVSVYLYYTRKSNSH